MKNKIIGISFLAYLMFFSIGSVIAKDRGFSQMENRVLAGFPEISANNILSGKFSKDFEEYMSDQIILKDTLVRIRIIENRVMGQTLINDTFFAEDDMLIAKYNNPYNQLSVNINYVNDFADENTDLNISWFVIPNACMIYEEKLPSYAVNYDQNETLAYMYGSVSEKIHLFDCADELMSAKDEYIYYRTDHHWTMNGAYIGYRKLCDELSLNVLDKDDYEITVGSSEFYGTLYSKVPTFTQKPDDIILYNNPSGEYAVEYIDKGVISDSLYNMDNLNIKDKYTTYLDGNHSIIKIESNAVSGDNGKLLVVKDSYAHCMLPFLADNYSEIYVVDLRYYHDSVSAFARENEIQDILLINNIDFISTDSNFLWLY